MKVLRELTNERTRKTPSALSHPKGSAGLGAIQESLFALRSGNNVLAKVEGAANCMEVVWSCFTKRIDGLDVWTVVRWRTRVQGFRRSRGAVCERDGLWLCRTIRPPCLP